MTKILSPAKPVAFKTRAPIGAKQAPLDKDVDEVVALIQIKSP